MPYRKLMVESPVKISIKRSQLTINGEEERSVPLEDVDAVVLESRGITVTTAALAELAQNNSAVFVCDEKHLPCGVLIPFAQHSRQLAALNAQLLLTVPEKKRLWQQVVKAKIMNQSRCLHFMEDTVGAARLEALAKSVLSGDPQNAEAAAAAYYFPHLFGQGFCRAEEDVRNAAMNYGYAIFRGILARTIAAYGFLPAWGIHHHSELNAFNLADDLMEPFRPLVDLYTALIMDGEEDLQPCHKRSLYNLLNMDMLSGGKRYSAADCAERLVQSFLRCCKKEEKHLLLPELIELKVHRYE